jgi:hypothetical protein
MAPASSPWQGAFDGWEQTMSANHPESTSSAAADVYRIHVRGHLDDCWSEWLGGYVVERHGDGTTVLVGPVVDQAALHGVLTRIRDSGLTILSVNLTSTALGESPHDGDGTSRAI